MEFKIYVPEYEPSQGIKLVWEDGFVIESTNNESSVVIRANKEGLISLARHLLMLAQDNVPVGTHVQLDELNSLEDASCEILIERI